jgi:hypothetical protein
MRRFLLVLLLGLTTTAYADFKWDQPWQEFHGTPKDDHVDATFTFRNIGTETLTIRSVKTSCGCTTAQLEKKIYAPGEAGEIVTRFKFGSRKGTQRKLVTVTNQDGTKKELNIVVHFEQGLIPSTSLLYWRAGVSAAAQTMRLRSEPGLTINVTKVSSSNPRFTATLQTVKLGEEYLVSVKPIDSQRDEAEITIETDYPLEAPRPITVYARIK